MGTVELKALHRKRICGLAEKETTFDYRIE
jgi:hypothetical protein